MCIKWAVCLIYERYSDDTVGNRDRIQMAHAFERAGQPHRQNVRFSNKDAVSPLTGRARFRKAQHALAE